MIRDLISILFALFVFIIDSIFAFLYKKNTNSIKCNRLFLVIHQAGIGDYILFRNFIEIIKNSKKYKEYKITLLGNIDWKDIAENLDYEYVEKYIWIDSNKFRKNLVYRYNKFKEILANSNKVVICPTYSRSLSSDNIVKVLSAKNKIGSIGDCSNIKIWQKKISDKYYTKLIPQKKGLLFEFYRNKEFFENLLETKLDIKKTFIKLKNKKMGFGLPQNYVVLFVGARARFRKWDVKNFVKIAKYIKKKYNLDIILCGGSTDIEDVNEFQKYFFKDSIKYKQGDYIDLVGKTSLIDLIYVISNGNLMIANETSAPHFAVALGINTLVISNGNHFGRFTPYPKEMTDKYHVIYHPEIEKDLDNYKKLSSSYGYKSKLDINEISVKSVLEKVDNILEVTRTT